MADNSKPSKVSKNVDIATVSGVALALAGIIGGLLLEKGQIQDIVQGTAALIVLGGTFGAVLVTTPMPVIVRALKQVPALFLTRKQSVPALLDEIIGYATKARKNGIVSLEREADAIADPFLRKALNLAVDGTDMQEMRRMMELEISLSEQFGEAEAKVYECAGGYSPTIGIIGAVMGLIQVMKHLEDIKEVGHGIAVAFVATVYGVGAANIFLLPAGNKLRARLHDAVMLKELMLEGVVGIVEGLNPKLLRMKLEAYLPDQTQPKPPAPAAGQPAAPAAPPVAKAGQAAA
jgi:chemotaxis protein MotA